MQYWSCQLVILMVTQQNLAFCFELLFKPSFIYIILYEYAIIDALIRSESTLYEDKELDAQVVPDKKETESLTDCVVPDYRSNFESNPDLELSYITAGLNISSLSALSYHPAPPAFGLHQALLRPRSATASAGLATNSSGATGYSGPLYSTTDIQRKYSHGAFTNRTAMVVASRGVSRSSEQLHVHGHYLPSPNASQRTRRNSMDSDKKARRHSAAHFCAVPPGIQRQRRRSHDARDNQSDLLRRLHNAATGRRFSVSATMPQASRLSSVDQSD